MQQVLIALRCYATETFELVIGDLFGVSVFTRFQGLLRNEKNISCHSLRTWLISRESFMMLRTSQVYPHKNHMSKQKKMLWHLLTESRFIPSTSKPFVIAMPLREGTTDGILVGDSGGWIRL